MPPHRPRQEERQCKIWPQVPKSACRHLRHLPGTISFPLTRHRLPSRLARMGRSRHANHHPSLGIPSREARSAVQMHLPLRPQVLRRLIESTLLAASSGAAGAQAPRRRAARDLGQELVEQGKAPRQSAALPGNWLAAPRARAHGEPTTAWAVRIIRLMSPDGIQTIRGRQIRACRRSSSRPTNKGQSILAQLSASTGDTNHHPMPGDAVSRRNHTTIFFSSSGRHCPLLASH